MEHEKLNVDLGFVRGTNSTVDVSSITDDFVKRTTREQILGFMDPAALFGLHMTDGVSATTYSGGSKATSSLTGQELYNSIISKYYTQNSVYIDIRSEKGYSYNYYINYGDSDGNNIQLGANNDGLAAQIYENNSWPILILTDPQTQDADDPSKNTTWFSLRVDDNINPLLYDVNIGSDPAFNDIYNNVNTWTNAFSYSFPNVNSDGDNGGGDEGEDAPAFRAAAETSDVTVNNVAYYVKTYYYRRQPLITPAPDLPNTVLSSQKYYHSAFAPIDIPNTGLVSDDVDYNIVESSSLLLIDEPLQFESGTGRFTHTANQNIIWDNDNVLFSSKLSKQFIDSEKKFLPTTNIQRLSILGKSSASIFKELNIICKTYKKVGDSQSFKIIGVNGYNNDKGQIKEQAIFLGITKNEFGILRSLISTGYKYIYLQRTSNLAMPLTNDPSIDSNGNPFYEYAIQLQGLSALGERIFITPTNLTPIPSPIFVYSRDNLFFCSPSFSASEQLTPGPNRIEFHAKSKNDTTGLIQVNDNIDLRLIAGRQPIYFFYNDVYITQFKTVMSNEVGKGQPHGTHKLNHVADPPVLFVPPADPPEDYQLIMDYRTNYPKIDAKVSYKNKKKGDILTYGHLTYTDFQGHVITTENYQIIYPSLNNKVVMVHFDNNGFDNNGQPSSNTYALHIDNYPNRDVHFSFNSDTQRRFAQPEIAACVIAVLIEVNLDLVSGGMSLQDGTCFPSVSHNNGEAVDIRYYPSNNNPDLDDNQTIINTLIKYGISNILIGLKNDPNHGTFFSSLKGSQGVILHPDAQHGSHIHAGKVKVRVN